MAVTTTKTKAKPFEYDNKIVTTVSVIKRRAPFILITKEALMKMFIYTDECDLEVGWLGTATKDPDDNIFYIDNVYLFDQDVHAATTEITPEGLATFGEKLLEENPETGMNIWNNIRVWGHSHNDMGTSPSTQDNDQMETFVEGGHKWFIRIITNKKGSLRCDVYDFEYGISYQQVAWDELLDDNEEAIRNQINALKLQLKNLNKQLMDTLSVQIKEEIKQKVKKIRANITGYGDTYDESYINGNWRNKDEKFINTMADVRRYFKNSEIDEIAKAKIYWDASTAIKKYSAVLFDSTEILAIWNFCKTTIDKDKNKGGKN